MHVKYDQSCKIFSFDKTLCVKTCKMFYQKNKCKTFYKNLAASCPTLSPFLIVYSSSLTLAQTSDNTHWHASLHLHSASTYSLLFAFILVAPPSDLSLFCRQRSCCERPKLSLITTIPLLIAQICSNLEILPLRSLIWNP